MPPFLRREALMASSFMDALVADLKRDEGERLRPYVDTVGKITIGVGHNLTDLGISQAISDALLAEDIAGAEWLLDTYFTWWRTLDEPRQLVVLNLAFNLGPRREQPERIAARKGLLAWTATMGHIQAGDYLAAAESLLGNQKWVGQVGKRAKRLADMLSSAKQGEVA